MTKNPPAASTRRAREVLRQWKPNVGEFFHSPRVEVAAINAMMAFAEQLVSQRIEVLAELKPLVDAVAGPNGWDWMFPLRVVPVDGKPTIVSHKGGDLFRGYIGTWRAADMLVALANAAPRILAALAASPEQPASEAVVKIVARQQSPIVADYGVNYLTAHVSADGKEVGIDHPCDAVWEQVKVAHIALRDYINERLAAQDKCPFKPKGAHPAESANCPVGGEALREAVEREIALLRRADSPWAIGIRNRLKQALALPPAGAGDVGYARGVEDAEAWQPIETAPADCVTEIDLWCEGSGDGEPGWLMRGILYPGQPQWLKRDDATDYFPHENGGYFTHWRPLPEPPIRALSARKDAQ